MLRIVGWLTAICAVLVIIFAVVTHTRRPAPDDTVAAPAELVTTEPLPAPEAPPAPPAVPVTAEPPPIAPAPVVVDEDQIAEDAAAVGMATREPSLDVAPAE